MQSPPLNEDLLPRQEGKIESEGRWGPSLVILAVDVGNRIIGMLDLVYKKRWGGGGGGLRGMSFMHSAAGRLQIQGAFCSRHLGEPKTVRS